MRHQTWQDIPEEGGRVEVGAGERLVGGSRKASLPAPVAADQMCSAPAASQDAMRAAVAVGEG